MKKKEEFMDLKKCDLVVEFNKIQNDYWNSMKNVWLFISEPIIKSKKYFLINFKTKQVKTLIIKKEKELQNCVNLLIIIFLCFFVVQKDETFLLSF